MSKSVRVRVKGINRQIRDTDHGWTHGTGVSIPTKRIETVVTLEGFDLFTEAHVLLEMIPDAKVGDDYEIRLERVEK